MLRLMVVTASTRPGRVGPRIAEWVHAAVRADERFELDPVDLAELALPFMDEPQHPARGEYAHDHTRAWSARVRAADAIVFVLPEYNHSYAPALGNALDYLFHEWARKPVGLVSYGGVSAGTRGVVALESRLSYLGLVRALSAVEIAHVRTHLDDDGFHPEELHERHLAAMLEELAALAPALAPLQRR